MSIRLFLLAQKFANTMQNLSLIDTHCHLPMLEHKELEQVLSDAQSRGVTRFICIGAADGYTSAEAAVALAEADERIFATVGIHPHDADSSRSMSALETLAKHPRVRAVGETGLDFFRDWSPFAEQERIFIESIELAKTLKKPLIIHCRDAHSRAIELLKAHGAADVGGVFHCYAESSEVAAQLAEMNFLVSVTGIITFKSADALRAEVRKIPLEQIMLETDCPYMAPVPYRGKPSEPAHVREIAETLADIKGIELAEVAQRTTRTAEQFFCLPS